MRNVYLRIPKHVYLVPLAVVQALLRFHLEFQRTGSEVDEQTRLTSVQFDRYEICGEKTNPKI